MKLIVIVFLLFTACIQQQYLIKQIPLSIGMKQWQVVQRIGEPDYKNISQYSFGRHEQWVYKMTFHWYMKEQRYVLARTSTGSTYLYFENDKLVSWQLLY